MKFKKKIFFFGKNAKFYDNYMCETTKNKGSVRSWNMLRNDLKLHFEQPGHFRRLKNKNLTLKKKKVYF